MKRLKGKPDKFLKSFLSEAGMNVYADFSAELNEEGELLVSGCNEILKYTADNITLKSKAYYLDVYGQNIYLKIFSVKKSVISGEINDIKLLKAGALND